MAAEIHYGPYELHNRNTNHVPEDPENEMPEVTVENIPRFRARHIVMMSLGTPPCMKILMTARGIYRNRRPF